MTASPFGPPVVIADPAAGRRSVGPRIPEVRSALDAAGLGYRLEISRGPEETSRLAREALEGGTRYVVAVGDDGTVQDVVNGMFLDGEPLLEDPVLAVIPAGSSCDLVRSFGLPEDAETAVGHLLDDDVYRFDVMKVTAKVGGGMETRYAHNVAMVGLHAAAHRFTDALPSWMSNAGRFAGFWSAYAASGPREVQLRSDAKTRTLRLWSLVVGNGQFSGGLRISPRSYPGDGVLDVLAFTGPRSDAYRMLPRIFRHGDHIPDPGIEEMRVKIGLGVEASRSMPVVADGRYLGRTPAWFQCVPQQILLKV